MAGSIPPDGQADLSWGRIVNNKVQDWVCRLILFPSGRNAFPEAPSFNLPRESHFLSFTRRIAFPIRLYNRASWLPILIRGHSWDGNEPERGIKEGTAFSPYFCDNNFSNEEEFAAFLKRWLVTDQREAP